MNALNEICEVYVTLSVQARQLARNDIPKMLRLFNAVEFKGFEVSIAILNLMEELLKDHAEAFVSELHSLYSKLQV